MPGQTESGTSLYGCKPPCLETEVGHMSSVDMLPWTKTAPLVHWPEVTLATYTSPRVDRRQSQPVEADNHQDLRGEIQTGVPFLAANQEEKKESRPLQHRHSHTSHTLAPRTYSTVSADVGPELNLLGGRSTIYNYGVAIEWWPSFVWAQGHELGEKGPCPGKEDKVPGRLQPPVFPNSHTQNWTLKDGNFT